MRNQNYRAFVALAVAVTFVLAFTLGTDDAGIEGGEAEDGKAVAEMSPTPEEQYGEHIVSSGENLTVISRRYGVPLEAVIQVNANEIPNPDLIHPGQRILIPVAAGEAEPPVVAEEAEPPVAAEEAEPSVAPVEVQTVPAIQGALFALDGREFVSDEEGIARIEVQRKGGSTHTLEYTGWPLAPSGVMAEFTRWYGGVEEGRGERLVTGLKIGEGRRVSVAFKLQYLISFEFVDLAGRAVDMERVTAVTMKSSIGERFEFEPGEPLWVLGRRVQPTGSAGLSEKDVQYSIEEVTMDGSNVVNRAQQRFIPREGREWRIQLLLYSARFSVRDALFRFPIGSAILLEYPDGRSERFPLEAGGELTLDSLPRGEYQVSIDGPGISFSRPMALSRNQEVSVELISYLDIAVAALLVVSIILALLFVGRPRLRSAVRRGVSRLSLRRHTVTRKDPP